ncbi:MAG: class II aldolase/adducin family protein [Rhodospirillaceae bacterium]|jgi:HCOMODA/2-hydroxy-3-carboxy-muconic semialdehyde decarboxylase|nr:class II aldolase/adducin family protein [Rhodospirillaceae bacterium]MBT5456270.1 class II aldolase/adducin family protein [Rhodospirillaceae bacterium]
MEALLRAMQELVVANRILATEGVCDAFGHASVRHPDNSDRYIMARSRSPGVITIDDLMEYTLDGEPIDQRDRAMYAERHIHGGVYEKRPDALAVIHNHSSAIIPFGVTGVALRPILHMGSVAGGDIPTWDIHDKFGDTHLLVTNMDQGRDLATCLGDRRVALMRGHGCVIAGKSIKEAVMIAVYLETNARLQLQSLQLGEPTYLSPGEVALGMEQFVGDLAINRAWEYWAIRAGYHDA